MYKEEGLIRPVKGKNDPDLGSDALMIMIPYILNYVINTLNRNEYNKYAQSFFDFYTIKKKGNLHFCLAGPFIGAPQAVVGMEKLIALGVKRVWVLGWCGSLDPDLKIGDFLIPLDAISEEGTSDHYPIGKITPRSEEEMNRIMENYLLDKGLRYSRGKVWTTDAPYRETPSKVSNYSKSGISAVDMEISALLTLAFFRQVKLAGLFIVSDELFDLKWRPGFSDPKLKKRSKQAGQLFLELMESL